MRKLIFAIILLFICNFALSAQSKLTEEEYSVYAAILKKIRPDSLKDNTTQIYFVILDITGNSYTYDERKVSKIRGLAKHFKLVNKSPAKIENSFPIKQRYEITNISEIKKLLDLGGREFNETQQKRREKGQAIFAEDDGTYWKYFNKKYSSSGGYYQFSRVGFSSNKQFALVNLEYRGESSSGSSTSYILKKTRGKWNIYSSGGYSWIS